MFTIGTCMKKVITAAAAIVAALSGAGTANASCASLNGHDIGQGCTSTVGSASVALGHGAQASSEGPGAVVVAVGNPATSPFYGPGTQTAALASGPGSTSVAIGNGSFAGSDVVHAT